jgi:hypothetical protein
MKSKIIEKEKEENKIVYPCLMKCVDDDGLIIVLATENTTGTVVKHYIETEIGEYSESWSPFSFTNTWKPFEGTLELSN